MALATGSRPGPETQAVHSAGHIVTLDLAQGTLSERCIVACVFRAVIDFYSKGDFYYKYTGASKIKPSPCQSQFSFVCSECS